MTKGKDKKLKKKKNISITSGIVKVCATFNNTIISITDVHGNVVCWSSPGKLSFNSTGYFTSKNIPFVLNINHSSHKEIKEFLEESKTFDHILFSKATVFK